MTKDQLLQEMYNIGSCFDCFEYVREHPSRSAEIIGRDCIRIDWFMYYIIKTNSQNTVIRDLKKLKHSNRNHILATIITADNPTELGWAKVSGLWSDAEMLGDTSPETEMLKVIHKYWNNYCRQYGTGIIPFVL